MVSGHCSTLLERVIVSFDTDLASQIKLTKLPVIHCFEYSPNCSQDKSRVKLCSHLMFAFAFASTSPSKFNIASMETQTQTHRMGLNPFLTFYIDVDAKAKANVKCEHSITVAGCQLECSVNTQSWQCCYFCIAYVVKSKLFSVKRYL